jgi:hypothetical protein
MRENKIKNRRLNSIPDTNGTINLIIARVELNAEEDCPMILISRTREKKFKKSNRESKNMKKRVNNRCMSVLINAPTII